MRAVTIGRAEHAQPGAHALAQLGQHPPAGRAPRPGGRCAWRTRCRRPSGWVTRALLLGVGLGGEDHGGVLARAPASRKSANAITALALERRLQRGARDGRQRVGVQQQQRGQLASASARRSRRRHARLRRRRRGPGPRLGRQPTSRRPRPLVRAGHLDQPGLLALAATPSAPASASSASTACGAALAGDRALAPDDHHVARVAQHLGGGAHRVGRARRRPSAPARKPALARPGGQVVDAAADARRAQRGASAASAASAAPGAKRSAAAALGSSVRGPAGQPPPAGRRCGAPPCARAGRGSAPRPPARCRPRAPRRRGRCRTPAPTGRAGPARAPGPGAPAAGRARVHVRRARAPSRIRCWSEEALLVGGAAAHQGRVRSPGLRARPPPRPARAPRTPRAGSRRRAPAAR